jgi:DNA-binding PadR family transcriptional regulator
MAAGIGASCFAAASVVALQGLVAVAVPRHRLQRTLVAVQTLLVCEVALLLPGVLRLPRFAQSLQQHPQWLLAAAPGWFLGVERVIAGGRAPHDVRAAVIAFAGTALVFATVAACYVVLYRRFDQVSLQTPHHAAGVSLRMPRRYWVWHPAFTAVRAFAGATLRRSGPHQLVVFAALTSGLALAVNAVLLNDGASAASAASAAIGAPLMAILIATLGLRGALLMPLEIRAAWIFRLAERADCRVAQLNAVRLMLMWRGVMLPTVAIVPLQLAVIGWSRTLASIPVTLAIGWLLVELVIRDWRRIPFTCTVLFGKRPAGQTFGLLCALYVVFVVIGTRIAQLAASNVRSWLGTLGVLLVAAAIARWHRGQSWGSWPLEFEDSLPDGVDTLRLESLTALLLVLIIDRMARDVLNTFDLLILLAVIRLRDEAYGVAIAEMVGQARERAASIASVYAALDRLEAAGFITSELGEPSPTRGGRAKRYVKVTAEGVRAVNSTQRALTQMWGKLSVLKERRT